MPEGATPIVPFADAVRERYRFERELGAGGMATVFLATDERRREDDEYFGEGLPEELTSALSRLEGLRVVSRTSAVSFKATQPLLRNLNGDPESEAVVAKLRLPR